MAAEGVSREAMFERIVQVAGGVANYMDASGNVARYTRVVKALTRHVRKAWHRACSP